MSFVEAPPFPGKKESGPIDISGIDKAELLAALHNGTRVQGMGFLHAITSMSVEHARQHVEGRERLYFDYVCGRPLKVDISGDTLDPRLYDRDAGEGRAAEVVAKLRAKPVTP